MKLFSFCLAMGLSFQLYAQLGGRTSYSFLNRASSGRQMALGGRNISSTHKDALMFVANPALLSDSINNYFSMAYISGLAPEVHFGGAKKISAHSILGLHLQNIDYGTMERRDASGNLEGTFSAADFSVAVAYAQKINYLSLGAAMRYAQSRIDMQQGSAMFFDLGATFFHPKADLKVSIALKNLGFRLREISATEEFVMPLNLQAGATYKPSGMPLRFSLTAHHLNRFMSIAYDDPSQGLTTDILGNQSRKELSTSQRFSRHLTLGAELVITPGFNLRAGYDFMRRAEMKLPEQSSGAGFSFGIMLRIKSFEVSYSRLNQALRIADNCISLSFDVQKMFTAKDKLRI
jgi:hypothetical protein